MPRWVALWIGGIVGGGAGVLVFPLVFATVGEMFGSGDQGPGFLGFAVGIWTGPFLGAALGLWIAWRATRRASGETTTAA